MLGFIHNDATDTEELQNFDELFNAFNSSTLTSNETCLLRHIRAYRVPDREVGVAETAEEQRSKDDTLYERLADGDHLLGTVVGESPPSQAMKHAFSATSGGRYTVSKAGRRQSPACCSCGRKSILRMD